MPDEVLVARAHADAPFPAATLVAVGGNRGALDVPRVADRNRHVFLGDQIFDADVARLALDDLRASIVPVRVADRFQLVHDDLHQQALAGQDGAQALDRLQQLGELVEDLLPLEAGQPLQLHVEDRLRLNLREAELGHQPVARLAGRLRPANERDDRVQLIERDLEPFEDVIARLGLLQLEFGPAPDDLAAELDEAFDQLQQIQDLRAGRRRWPA